ncbi:MAG: helix-turn-helix domain-containing protein [Candidatus Riflebacteria bacterium]|nr:helix-turn-helix domain-containing protein [Candidatus Riflebacteria bacterium]
MAKTQRDIFRELCEGIADMKADREEKLTLRRVKVERPPRFNVGGAVIAEIRNALNLSRSVFARKLHINERTLEKWEQGRAKPNNQAVALILLAKEHPETLDWLAELVA